jgi:thiol:disulfide interchange protein
MRTHPFVLATALLMPFLASAAEDPKPARPNIYDEKADAPQQIAEAAARAKLDHKRVLVQWGANWCGWCHKLHEVCSTNADLKKVLHDEYEVVLVDVGRFDKNAELAEKLGAQLKGNGVPYLTVLDEDGKTVVNQDTGSLEAGPDHDVAKVLKFLNDHVAPRVDAEAELTTATSKAKNDGKLVFVHFGAPWCGWCTKLDAWLASPDVAAAMGSRFVDVKIDTERMTHGADVLKRFRGPNESGIPWFVALDADGKVIATSEVNGKNLGFPSTDAELEGFDQFLTKANVEADSKAKLLESLRAARDAKK